MGMEVEVEGPQRKLLWWWLGTAGCGGRAEVAFWMCSAYSCPHLVAWRVRQLEEEVDGGFKDGPKAFGFPWKDGYSIC